jgi:hypothetical protein
MEDSKGDFIGMADETDDLLEEVYCVKIMGKGCCCLSIL